MPSMLTWYHSATSEICSRSFWQVVIIRSRSAKEHVSSMILKLWRDKLKSSSFEADRDSSIRSVSRTLWGRPRLIYQVCFSDSVRPTKTHVSGLFLELCEADRDSCIRSVYRTLWDSSIRSVSRTLWGRPRLMYQVCFSNSVSTTSNRKFFQSNRFSLSLFSWLFLVYFLSYEFTVFRNAVKNQYFF
jgi:hypothetical protein